MNRTNIAFVAFFVALSAHATGYVHKTNGAGGRIELSDRPMPAEAVRLVPECKGGFEAKNSVPDKMNVYGCWWPDHSGMITVKWFDPYNGVVTYTYDPKDFRK